MLSLLLPVLIQAVATSTQVPAQFPRIAMLWSPYDGTEPYWQKANRYSLVLVGSSEAGLEWTKDPFKAAVESFSPSSVRVGSRRINDFSRANPSSQVIVESYFFEANKGDYPEDSPWWERNADGSRTTFWPGCYNMKTDNPDYVTHIANRISATDKAMGGKHAGVYIDNLRFDSRAKSGWKSLLNQIHTYRPGMFVMANAGWDSTDLAWVAPHLNGIMYEDSVDHTADNNQEAFYKRVSDYDSLMRKPTLSVVEVFGQKSDRDKAYRELVRTLVYTNDAYLYSDNTNGHRHVWRPEWSVKLGQPLEGHGTPNGKVQLRNFQRGAVVWNPTAMPVSVKLRSRMTEVRSHRAGLSAQLEPHTGAMFVR